MFFNHQVCVMNHFSCKFYYTTLAIGPLKPDCKPSCLLAFHNVLACNWVSMVRLQVCVILVKFVCLQSVLKTRLQVYHSPLSFLQVCLLAIRSSRPDCKLILITLLHLRMMVVKSITPKRLCIYHPHLKSGLEDPTASFHLSFKSHLQSDFEDLIASLY